jgi:hypothetical protein
MTSGIREHGVLVVEGPRRESHLAITPLQSKRVSDSRSIVDVFLDLRIISSSSLAILLIYDNADGRRKELSDLEPLHLVFESHHYPRLQPELHYLHRIGPILMIKLNKPAIPFITPNLRSITRHPSFCGVCLNLSPLVAEACNGGRENLYFNGQAWDFTCSFTELLAAIGDGCASCWISREVVDGVFPGVVAWGEKAWDEKELMVTMVEGNVLRVYLPDFFDGVKMDEIKSGLSTDVLSINATLELYAYERR